ncbi:hypothetical protein ACJJTC_013474 [Scirpophaga incertulas]
MQVHQLHRNVPCKCTVHIILSTSVNVEKYLDQNEVYNQKKDDGSDSRNIEPIAGPSGLNATRKRDRGGTSADTDDSVPARRRLFFTKPRGRSTGARGGCNSFIRRDRRTEENESIAETPFRATSSPYEETNQAEKDGRGDIPESAAMKEAAKSLTTTQWVAQWAKENTTMQDINYLPWKPRSTNVVKLHVFSAFWSTLLPALIAQHLEKFSPTVIKELQCVSLIRWDLIHNGKLVTTLEVPKGEITYFDSKAQHEVLGTPEFVKALLVPIKTYLNLEKMNALVECESEQHDVGNQPNALCRGPGFKLLQEMQKLYEKIKRLVMYLCENQAFDKGKATLLLSSTIEGCNAYFNRYFRERLTHALCIAKALVFQESTKQRFERAKQYQLKKNPHAAGPRHNRRRHNKTGTVANKKRY